MLSGPDCPSVQSRGHLAVQPALHSALLPYPSLTNWSRNEWCHRGGGRGKPTLSPSDPHHLMLLTREADPDSPLKLLTQHCTLHCTALHCTLNYTDLIAQHCM